MSAVAEQEQYEGEGEFEDEAVLGESNPELDAMKSKLAEIEAEARKLEEMQEQVDGLAQSSVDKEEVDSRSVFVGNVDFGTKPAELQQHFEACGAILRVTILCPSPLLSRHNTLHSLCSLLRTLSSRSSGDKWTGHPKGFAYVEFMEQESVPRAVELNESIFRGRPLKARSSSLLAHTSSLMLY